MTDKGIPTAAESFDHLLAWLHPDREEAGQRYEEIRRRLIRIFAGRDCCEPEDLADETLRRVELKVDDVAPTWINDPVLYFYAVARNVRREYGRRKRVPTPPPPPPPNAEEAEREDRCLEHCMRKLLTSDERSLMLQYYQGQGRTKIENRQELCRQYALGQNALRIRMHRLTKLIRPCIFECVGRAAC